MAIFGEHIKGVNHSTANSCYTWLQGGTPTQPAPVLCVARSNNYETAKLSNYGELALAGPSETTSSRTSLDQNIYTNGHIKKFITLEGTCRLPVNGIWSTGNNDQGKTFLKFQPATTSIQDTLQGGDSQLRIVYTGYNKEALTLKENYAHVFDGAVGFSDPAHMDASLTVKNKVEALYFNATSDKRAKENLCVYTDSALDIINRVQVYTFNYRHHDKRTVGLLAQDLLDYNLNGVCLVDNVDATGLDNDYMTINESKLVYVLGKAIQEQQALINQLEERIKKLEN